jgi:hypothetical protein
MKKNSFAHVGIAIVVKSIKSLNYILTMNWSNLCNVVHF